MSPQQGLRADGLRRNNLGVVLQSVHRHGSRSRSELASDTGLNRSTVMDLVGELAALGLVTERDGAAGDGPGRPSRLVCARPDALSVLAVEIDVDTVALATVGLAGAVRDHVRVPRPPARHGANATVHDVQRLAAPLLAGLGDVRLVGVGVAVVGAVEPERGLVRLAPNLGWREVPLVAALESVLRMDVPVLLGNEADLGARGERLRGAGRDVDDLLYVSGEVGIGVGIVSRGQPLTGASGLAGEAGHLPVNPSGRPCACGATGCWETEAGTGALLRRAGRRPGSDRAAQVAAVLEEARSGRRRAVAAVQETASWVGVGLAGAVNVLDPRRIVLGGWFAQLHRLAHATITASLERHTLLGIGRRLDVVPAQLGVEAPLLGAAELALASILRDPAGARS